MLDLPAESGGGELGRMAREKRLVAMPAPGGFTEARRRNAIYLLAVRTYQVQRFSRFSHACGMGSRPGIFKAHAALSEALLPGSQVELECPGAAVLMVQVPKGCGDRVRVEQSILRTQLLQLRIA